MDQGRGASGVGIGVGVGVGVGSRSHGAIWSHGEDDRMTLDGVVRDCRVLVRIEPCEKSIIQG